MTHPKLKTVASLVLACVALTGRATLGQSTVVPATSDGTAAQPATKPHESPKIPVTVNEDTLIRVRTIEPINSKRATNGTPLLFMVSEDVMFGDVLAIPRGEMVHGEVVKSKKAGTLTGSPERTRKRVSRDLGGRN